MYGEKNVQVEVEARNPSWKLGVHWSVSVRPSEEMDGWLGDPVQPGWVSGIIRRDTEVLGRIVKAGIQIRTAKILKYGTDGSHEEGCGTLSSGRVW